MIHSIARQVAALVVNVIAWAGAIAGVMVIAVGLLTVLAWCAAVNSLWDFSKWLRSPDRS